MTRGQFQVLAWEEWAAAAAGLGSQELSLKGQVCQQGCNCFLMTQLLLFICWFFNFCLHWVFVAVCRLSLVVARRGYSLFVVCRLMIAGPPLVAVRRLLAHRLQ